MSPRRRLTKGAGAGLPSETHYLQVAEGKKTQLAPGVYLIKASDSETTLLLSAKDLPVPDRSMFANWVTANRTGSDVQMIFGQWRERSDRLSAALILSMASRNVARSLYGEKRNSKRR